MQFGRPSGRPRDGVRIRDAIREAIKQAIRKATYEHGVRVRDAIREAIREAIKQAIRKATYEHGVRIRDALPAQPKALVVLRVKGGGGIKGCSRVHKSLIAQGTGTGRAAHAASKAIPDTAASPYATSPYTSAQRRNAQVGAS